MNASKSPLATTPKFWLGDETTFDGAQLFNSNRPIVVFDSGVGGLTVARQLERLIPNANILYVADNGWFPYGNKAGPAVAHRVQQLFDRLCERISPSAIVVACNTASMAIMEHGLDQLRHNCFLVTPPIGDAVDTSANKNIVLLATPGTVKSRYIIQKIAKARMHARIWPIATQALVTLSEARLAGEEASFISFAELIDNYLTEEQRLSVDTVVLGCTHFPHLIDDLRKIFPNTDNWIDPAKKVAMQVVSLTKKEDNPINMPLKIVLFTSKQDVAKYHQVFTKNGFGAIQPIDRRDFYEIA
ncbi:glutamate racemase [Pseudomonas fluorescens]|uniref:Glutamate racemase n=1 Tax=Pseudomonas fluorescens TaxID=294 RepID=A0A5E7V0V4_PSEFL|nr:glutamate racemase [Pseudomonas fluorescens]VVN90714.1 Glutamate racemase [Pseudomonas fluorescens]VVQ16120.1 Glutamate racemase [Pseudomonas fluorescens]